MSLPKETLRDQAREQVKESAAQLFIFVSKLEKCTDPKRSEHYRTLCRLEMQTIINLEGTI